MDDLTLAFIESNKISRARSLAVKAYELALKHFDAYPGPREEVIVEFNEAGASIPARPIREELHRMIDPTYVEPVVLVFRYGDTNHFKVIFTYKKGR